MTEHAKNTPLYSWYALTLLMIVYVLNFLDRTIIYILFPLMTIIYILFPLIKKEMAFSDTQLALLGTTSFVIFYTVLGIPFGRGWLTGFPNEDHRLRCRCLERVFDIDRFRRWLLASFWLPRDGGSWRSNARPSGDFSSIGLFPSAAAGDRNKYLLDGNCDRCWFGRITWRNAQPVWVANLVSSCRVSRHHFGNLVFLLREPERTRTNPQTSSRIELGSNNNSGILKRFIADILAFVRSIRILVSRPGFAFLCLGYALLGLTTNNLSIWGATFYSRVHKFDLLTIGFWGGILALTAGILATLLGGAIAD